MSSYYGNIRSSNSYGQFYQADPWGPSSLLKDPMVIKNKVPVRPGRTYEDYGEFYGDPKLRNNIRSYLGGYWGRPSAIKDSMAPQPMARDWEREKEVLRSSHPGALAAGRPSMQDGVDPPVDTRRMSAYDSPRQSQNHPLQDGHYRGSRESNRSLPRWNLQVDPWKSEYRRHYKNDRDTRFPEIKQLDALTQRRGLGDGGQAYVDEYPRAPAGYLN